MEALDVYFTKLNQSTIRLVPYITTTFPRIKKGSLCYHPWVMLWDCGFISAYAYNNHGFNEPVYLFNKVSKDKTPLGIYPIQIISESFELIAESDTLEVYVHRYYKEIPLWKKLPDKNDVLANVVCNNILSTDSNNAFGVYFTSLQIPYSFIFNTNDARILVQTAFNSPNVYPEKILPDKLDIKKETLNFEKNKLKII